MKPLDEKETGARVKLIRQMLKLKQSEFAEKTGMSGPSLSELENGKYKPGVDFLVKLHLEYKVNIYYVLFGAGDMFIDQGFPNLLEGKDEYWVHIDEVREFLYYFKRSRLFQYDIMSEVWKKLMSSRSVYDQDIQFGEEGKSGEEEE
ncbi:MAG: helix-turn-helix transcriptional regulator [bacterium]|nr:helix-turn-helix transcriptional regulator [bacterium]